MMCTNRTIEENLRLSNPLATDDDILQALKMAAIDKNIEDLPDYKNTTIGRGGDIKLSSSVLSGLSLARAYLNPAPILLIDELPNTLLSSQTGENLKHYLRQIKGKRTVLFCTYREDFMRLADTIVCLNGLEKPISEPRDQFFDKITKQSKVV